jgi:GcrA cell cycle regulator
MKDTRKAWHWSAEREAIIEGLWPQREISFQEIRHRVGDPPDHVLYRKATALGLGPRHKGKPRGATMSLSEKLKRKSSASPERRSNSAGQVMKLKKLQKDQAEGGQKRFPLPKTRPEDLAIPVEQRRTLFDLKHGQCKWPVGHPNKPDFFFCGDSVTTNLPYCAMHAKRAYLPVTKK